MKKLFSLFGLLYFLFDLFETVSYDLMPVLTSNETTAYKAGFIFSIFIALIAITGCCYFIYESFFIQESDNSKAVA